MGLFAIADLHLSFDERINKPMNVFGDNWIDHWKKVEEYWQKMITDDDLVIIAGDISWGMKLDEAMADLEFIDKLNGKKLIFKGNHDLWWSGMTKLNSLFDSITFVHNTYYGTGDIAICGTRGWTCPGSEEFTEADEKIYNREAMRLRTSLELAKQDGYTKIIGVLHYPPTNELKQSSKFTRLFEEYNVKTVVYGHLHGESAKKNKKDLLQNGISYKLISLDAIKCKPIELKY